MVKEIYILMPFLKATKKMVDDLQVDGFPTVIEEREQVTEKLRMIRRSAAKVGISCLLKMRSSSDELFSEKYV